MAEEVINLSFKTELWGIDVSSITIFVCSKILFEKNEVFIHEPPKDEVNGSLTDTKIGGRLQIIGNVSFRDWPVTV